MSLPELDNKPTRDEIIAEVRAVRAALAAEFEYDLDRLYEAAKRWEAAAEQERLEPSPKRLTHAAPAPIT